MGVTYKNPRSDTLERAHTSAWKGNTTDHWHDPFTYMTIFLRDVEICPSNNQGWTLDCQHCVNANFWSLFTKDAVLLTLSVKEKHSLPTFNSYLAHNSPDGTLSNLLSFPLNKWSTMITDEVDRRQSSSSHSVDNVDIWDFLSVNNMSKEDKPWLGIPPPHFPR